MDINPNFYFFSVNDFKFSSGQFDRSNSTIFYSTYSVELAVSSLNFDLLSVSNTLIDGSSFYF